jgi:tetratricopeptide (TPR) repeat protein
MKCWRVVGAAVISLFLGCAVTPYRQAETYISKKEYRQALQIYLRALNPRTVNGKRVIGYEPEAMTGIGVVLYHMKRTNTAARVLSQVARRTPQYGKALYYLGGCYETLKKPDMAADVYRRYGLLDTTDPYRETMRWRSAWISKQNLSQEIRKAVAEESSINASSLPRETVAVLYFQNPPKNVWSPLQKGIAQMIIDDLSNIEPIKVVGRDKVQKLMETQGWKPQSIAQDSRNLQLGRLLGARNLVRGAFKTLPGQKIEFSVGTVVLPETRPVETSRYDGTFDQIFSLEKRMVRKIIADLGVTLTAEQERLISGIPTRDLKAFTQYCFGLDNMDAGKFDAAQRNFRQALAIDADFFMAQDWVVDPELYRATQSSQFAAMNDRVEAMLGAGAGTPAPPGEAGGAFAVTPTGRLQELGVFMDAGFIPSNDSRDFSEFAGEFYIPPVPPVDNRLPAAPAPPFTPSRWVLPGPPSPPSKH